MGDKQDCKRVETHRRIGYPDGDIGRPEDRLMSRNLKFAGAQRPLQSWMLIIIKSCSNKKIDQYDFDRRFAKEFNAMGGRL